MARFGSFFEGLLGMIKHRVAAATGVSMLGTGSYVSYKDKTRYPRICAALKKGAILAPLIDNHYETTYFTRPAIEKKLMQILEPNFTNQYYLIHGEVGTGKTRTVVEMVRRLMLNARGDKSESAPVYVSASQGKSLPDTLAAAIDFCFDEHISFQFFINFLLKIHSFPGKDEHNKMNRVLDAIEKASFAYMKKEGKPAVIIIDGIGRIDKKTLHKLQEKAKLWADCNIVKLVFVSNDEMTEELLQKNASDWSRVAAPLQFEDLSEEESIRFLTTPRFYEAGAAAAAAESATRNGTPHGTDTTLDEGTAAAMFALVGGRIQNLLTLRRDFLRGVPFSEIAENAREMEREKFLHIKKGKNVEKALKMILAESGVHKKRKGVLMAKLVAETSEAAVHHLAEYNVVKFDRTPTGMYVAFESRLTENVVTELDLVC